MKTENTIDKILKQQEKNRYYLNFLGKKNHIYTYVLNENKLYKLVTDNNHNTIKEVDFTELCNKLSCQQIANITNIDSLFNPSDYLVSPFNSTDKFINDSYFLTVQQDQICNKIQMQLADSSTRFIALTGGAGTGKTLLTYHIAKKAMNEGMKVLILHCAQLNNGHFKLIEECNWNIYMTKYAPDINNYDLIIVDEAQRMCQSQFNKLTNATLNKKCIFSYDEKQYLRDNERNFNIKEKVEKNLGHTPYKLANKIRTNKEIAYFIKQLFNLYNNIPNGPYPNIELICSTSTKSTKSILEELSCSGWKIPNYTPSTNSCSQFCYEKYSSGDKDSAHSVIGQEFDKVAIVIDDSFTYNSLGELTANNKCYSQSQMLYQIITRTRKKLCVIVADNEEMLNRCIDILSR